MNRPFYIGQELTLYVHSPHNGKTLILGYIVGAFFNTHPNKGRPNKDWRLLIRYEALYSCLVYIEKERWLSEVTLIKKQDDYK